MSRIDKTGGISTTGIETAPTNERRTQNGGVVSEAVSPDTISNPVNRYRAVYECALDVYLHRKLITEPQHLAGLRFRQAYRRAVLSAGATRERLNHYPSTERLTKSEKLIKDAHRTLSSHNMGVIIDVCGHDHILSSPKSVESLKKGLEHLAIRWRMAAIEICAHGKK